MARVVLENISKWFKGPKGEPIWAVDQMQLDVASGELLVMVGPSGCGKTSTLRLIAGLDEVSRGRIWMEGRLMNDVPAKNRDIAMVFQNGALYPHLTVYDNLGFGLKIRKHSSGEIDMRVRESADTLDLTPHLKRYPNELSSGERQRVALGRALVRNPKVFLFDEATDAQIYAW
jgi:multiple sugar transport system ATP-binding protein